jgi:CRISP-associated protein Cas1
MVTSPSTITEEAPADRLARLGERLRTGEYAAPNLRGVIVREPDGDLRPLTIPPFIDRVAQRAAAQALSPGLEQLMYHGSFGYRPRRSRESARAAIQAAYREGYRWVYESDIDDFFDTVDWDRLKTRLIALYGDDPLVALILSWMAAPVEYQGELIARRAGLSQGAPLSSLLANLMLDDFDADLEHGGFCLIRFADDFMALCKDRAEAEAAARTAVQSLADLGLRLNPGKSQILPFAQGFRYLGYLFVDSLALDVSGEKAATASAAAPATAPPHSWLARLASRTPQILTAEGQLRPVEPSAPAATLVPEADLPMQLGESEDQGTVLFVTGRSALL